MSTISVPHLVPYPKWQATDTCQQCQKICFVACYLTNVINSDFRLHVGTNGAAGWTGPVFPNSTNPDGGFDASAEHYERDDGCLYDIINDLGEHVQ